MFGLELGAGTWCTPSKRGFVERTGCGVRMLGGDMTTEASRSFAEAAESTTPGSGDAARLLARLMEMGDAADVFPPWSP